MSTNLEKISSNRVKLTIEVTLKQWEKALDEAFQKKVKEIKVDGFRPGKLPKASYIKRFGYESLYEEALNRVFSATYPLAVQEQKVQVVSQPSIDLDIASLTPDQGFTYTAEVDVLPEVELGEYKGLKVTPLSKEVTPEEVEAEVKKLLEQKAENVIKEAPAEAGDTVVIDFEGFINDVPFEGGKAENYPLELGSNSFIPGFEDQLVGKRAGDECDVKVTFPEKYQEELAGKDATFKVKVHEVKKKVIPDWTDEFVKELEIENVNTVEEHRKHLSDNLAKQKVEAYEKNLEQSVIKQAVENAKIEIPESMILSSAEDLKNNVKKQAEQYKIPFEIYLQYMQLTPEKFEEESKKAAEIHIKEDLVLTEIAKDAKIEVSDDEIEEEYKNLAQQNNLEVDKVKELLKKDQVSYRVERTKVIELLKNSANLD